MEKIIITNRPTTIENSLDKNIGTVRDYMAKAEVSSCKNDGMDTTDSDLCVILEDKNGDQWYLKGFLDFEQ